MDLYFKEPRLEMTRAGAFIVRLTTYVAYTSLSVLTVILLFADIPNLKWLGGILALFLGDRMLHRNEGERSITAINKGGQPQKLNLTKVTTPKTHKLISWGFRKSLTVQKNFRLIMFKKLIGRKDIKEAVKRLGVDPKELRKKIDDVLAESETIHTKKELMPVVAELVEVSYHIAENTKEKFIEPRDVFGALSHSEDPQLKKVLGLYNISAEDLREAIIFGRFRSSLAKNRRAPSVLGGFAHKPGGTRKRIMNRAWTARPTPFLDKFSQDLTALARAEKSGLLIGHKEEFEMLLNAISRPDKPNALLVGEPGIGKSALIHHMAFRIIKDEVPKVLFDKRLVKVDFGMLIANASPDKVADRLNKIADEILTAGNVVLFIPNIHNLFRPVGDSEETITPIDVLLPIIKNSSIPLIGESYSREYKQYIEQRSEFLEQFETIRVEEVMREEAIRILTYQSIILEREFDMTISLVAIRKAVDVAYKYLHSKALPDSAIDLLKQSLARASQEGLEMLDESTVVDVAQNLSRVPIQQAEGEEAEKLLNLEDIIHERLINQDAAVKAVSRSIREYRSGLSKEGNPIATFLFVGPTGVGKTELAKQLTKVQFGSRKMMERFDMSEFQDKKSVFRLIGSPDGEKTGSLTDAVLENPHTLLLLDEFEKAHPDILNLFLQVFDDGRLTDSLERTVSFENTIIIATSNAQSNFIKSEIEKGRSAEELANDLKQKLTKDFKPELLNRFTEVIVFRSLNPEEIRQIARIMVDDLADKIRKSHGIELTINDSAVDKLSKLGYDPTFGARPLENVISEQIKDRLAQKILKKEIGQGNSIEVLYKQGNFKFKVVE